MEASFGGIYKMRSLNKNSEALGTQTCEVWETPVGFASSERPSKALSENTAGQREKQPNTGTSALFKTSFYSGLLGL